MLQGFLLPLLVFTQLKVFTTSLNFNDSKKSCEDEDSHLAIFHSKKEQEAVNGFIRGDIEVWIGLRVVEGTRNFTWIDNSTVNFANWGTNQPNNNGVSVAPYV